MANRFTCGESKLVKHQKVSKYYQTDCRSKINCLNKDLITYFVWYLGKKKGMVLKLCQCQLSKTFKKLKSFFVLNPVSFNGQNYPK